LKLFGDLFVCHYTFYSAAQQSRFLCVLIFIIFLLHLAQFVLGLNIFGIRRWRQTSETDQVVISHNVTNYEFFYEPFYTARDEAPPHDERFLG
jgi:hypothetical protein